MRLMALDLGKRTDHAALVIGEAVTAKPRFRVGFCKRWELGTKYLAVAKEVAELKQPEGTELLVDRGGVGDVEVEVLEALATRFTVVPVLTTGGLEAKQDGHEWHVPKVELVSPLVVALEHGDIVVGPSGDADQLKKELLNFRKRLTGPGRQRLEAASGFHDDLTMALAMLVWYGDKFAAVAGQSPVWGGRCKFDSAPRGVYGEVPRGGGRVSDIRGDRRQR